MAGHCANPPWVRLLLSATASGSLARGPPYDICPQWQHVATAGARATAWNMTEPMKPRLTSTRGGYTDTPPPMLLYVITVAAVLLGLWGRFKGLGTWPLNSDEYYIARSVEDILRTGLPGYDCGGYYVRGLAFQYPVALLQWAGVSAELSASARGRRLQPGCTARGLPARNTRSRPHGGAARCVRHGTVGLGSGRRPVRSHVRSIPGSFRLVPRVLPAFYSRPQCAGARADAAAQCSWRIHLGRRHPIDGG